MAELPKYGYFILPLNLTIARTNSEFFTGIKNTLYVVSITDENAQVQIRFDSTSDEPINLKTGYEFNFEKDKYFSKIYITNLAVASGIATLIFTYDIGVHTPLRVTSDQLNTGIKSSVVTIGATATPIPAVSYTNRVNIIIKNIDVTNNIYIGNSTVTTTTGYILGPSSSISFNIGQGVTIYGIVAAGTANVCILEGA